MPNHKATSFAPASIGNLSVGFDTLGLALPSLGDTVSLAYNNSSTNRIVSITGTEKLPFDLDKNCVSVVIENMQKALDDNQGLDIELHKGLPIGSGLGSSSASSAAAALAYNQLKNSPFSRQQLTDFAVVGEEAVVGTRHLDNVAPAIFGGMVLVDADEQIHQLPIPDGLVVLACWQDVTINTSDARKQVPEQIPVSLARKQWASTALFVSALYEKDFTKIQSAMRDYIAEPNRKHCIPHFDSLKSLAMNNNALHFGISGSGPTVFALFTNLNSAQECKQQIESFFHQKSIAHFFVVEKLG